MSFKTNKYKTRLNLFLKPANSHKFILAQKSPVISPRNRDAGLALQADSSSRNTEEYVFNYRH